MHDSIWQSIASTPWWAYVLFGYFAFLCYRATKPQVVMVRKVLVMPTLITLASMAGMYFLVKPTAVKLGYWAVMFVLGSGLGWLHFSIKKIKAIEGGTRLVIPGSLGLTAVFIIAITAKYYFGYPLSLDADFIQAPQQSLSLVILYGLSLGLFFGRMLYILHIAKSAPLATTATLTS